MTFQDENVVALTVRLRTPGERSYAAAQWRFLHGEGGQPDHRQHRRFRQGRAANPNPTLGNEIAQHFPLVISYACKAATSSPANLCMARPS
jgi:hypothetical protein